ncbi:hypothetical protein [uncultured Megasphaera sp.]|uniref:hypothetical protein n=1 Tax=uncultured Megasphaera sp. TaxID=165188 RepID=UPI00266D33DB|nr:hypothetical protein [uncultured Megasphaera sp.]
MHHNQRAAIDSTTRHIELMFYRERDIKRAVQIARENAAGSHGGGKNSHAFVPDPTAREGIRLATTLKRVTLADGIIIKNPERWLKLVSGVYDALDDISRRVATCKYKKRESWKSTTSELGIDKNTYYAIVGDVRTLAKMAACQLGLIRVI